MPQARLTEAANGAGTTEGPLARLVYRSRAVTDLGMPDLHQLTVAAQARNSREQITGLMLYDDNRFFQWLEGPPVNVDRVMSSIRNDQRHTDIEVLVSQTAPARTFGGWSMKLAAHGPQSVSWRRDVIEPPREVVEDLRRSPEAAPVLLVKLLPPNPSDSATQAVSNLPLQQKTAAILKNVLLSTVIPALSVQHAAYDPGHPLLAHAAAAELADLLIAPDEQAAVELIRELQAGGRPFVELYATLFEPAARSLGDLWGEDNCTEFDVTLGLSRLQSAVRLLSADTMKPRSDRAPRPVVLVAPEPGELHRLGATLQSNVLWNAGWAPHCEYPADDKSLTDLLSTTWFDVLDLSLSDAFRREHWLARMSDTIAEARRASCNPSLMVVVGGRVFFEGNDAPVTVGADVAARTALHADRLILKSLNIAASGADWPNRARNALS